LPHTGPTEDMFTGILGAGLLAGSVTAYRRSRAIL
jgi:LPXTG-motif cell wall-anchored protein